MILCWGYIYSKKLEKRIAELENKVSKFSHERAEFMEKVTSIMQSVLDNDKRKFMYELKQEDVELIEDGNKYRKIRKIIN